MFTDSGAYVNTILIALLGGLIGWFAQDMRRRVSNMERRLGATVKALFFMVSNDRRGVPSEALRALEEAMKETK